MRVSTMSDIPGDAPRGRCSIRPPKRGGRGMGWVIAIIAMNDIGWIIVCGIGIFAYLVWLMSQQQRTDLSLTCHRCAKKGKTCWRGRSPGLATVTGAPIAATSFTQPPTATEGL